jgi:hypothetical protein
MEPIVEDNAPAEGAPAGDQAANGAANAAPSQAEAGAVDNTPDEYAPVSGRSLADVEKVRQLESIAAQKTARDYQHVIWAYGILWALFAAYGIFLWRRSARIRADMDALRRELGEAK